MSRHAQTLAGPETAAVPRAAVLQRACACGAAGGVSGKCASCATDERLGVQPKLAINPPGDRWEQEADRIADQVVSDRPLAAQGPLPVTPLIQRQEATQEEDEEAETLQARHAPASGRSPARKASFARDLAAESQAGRPLDPETRAYFEPRFGRDLSAVRLHSGARAAQLSRDINARAFTHGQHVFFAAGQLDTRSIEGRHLLAHEITHSFQQIGAAPGLQRACPGLDSGVKEKITNFSTPQSSRRRNHKVDCCTELLGCDRSKAVKDARKRALARLDSAIPKLKNVVIGRSLRRLKRQLFGRSTTKRKIVSVLEGARKWLSGTSIAEGKDAKEALPVDAVNAATEKRHAAPSADVAPVEEETIIPAEEIPLEDTQEAKPEKPGVKGVPGGAPKDLAAGLVANPSEVFAPPSRCHEENKRILCSIGAACKGNTLAKTLDGWVRLCPRAFESELKLESTLIHEVMHNVVKGDERDVYVFNRLVRVLPYVRDPKGETGTIAGQNVDSYTAFTLAASGTSFDDFVKEAGGGPALNFEGILSRHRKRKAEIALGFSEAGINQASIDIHNLVLDLEIDGDWEKASKDKTAIIDDLLRSGLFAGGSSSSDVSKDLEHLTPIRNSLKELQIAVNSIREILFLRSDVLGQPRAVGSLLRLPPQFFTIRDQREQALEVIRIFVNSNAGTKSRPGAFVDFIEKSIGRREGLADLPFSSTAKEETDQEEKEAEPVGDEA